MNLLEKFHSLLPELAINKELSDDWLPVTPAQASETLELPTELPDFLTLEANGKIWCEYSILDPTDPLTHEAYAIFNPSEPLGDPDDGAVISRNSHTAWVRLALGAEGAAGLSVEFAPVGLDVDAMAKGEVSVFLPGDPEEKLGPVVQNHAAEYFRPGAFEPDNALPVGGGMEIAFDAGVSMGVSLDLSDLMALGVKKLAEAGATLVSFEPVSTSAKIHFKATVTGGFSLQIGRRADTEEGASVYRFRLAVRKSSSKEYGVTVALTGNLDASPAAKEFEEHLGRLVGIPDLVPVLAGEKGSEAAIEKALTDLGIPYADDAAEKGAELVKELRENLAENLKQEVGARLKLQFNRSTSLETLYQWKSVIPAGGFWDAALRSALLKRDIDAIHEIVQNSPGRCTAEIYRTKRIDQEGYDVGFDLSSGRWMVGGRSTRDFVFTRSRDRLAATEAFSFDIGQSRLLGRLTEVDFWKSGMEARPIKNQDADTFDELNYAFQFLWQSDKGEDGSKILGRQAVGEAVDLLYALRPDLEKERAQTDLNKAVCDVLDYAGWLGKEGYAVVEVETAPLDASDFRSKAETISRRASSRAVTARLASRALEWRKDPHRESVRMREQVFAEFFKELFPKDSNAKTVKKILRKMAKEKQPDAAAAKGLGKELDRNLPQPLPFRKRAYRGPKKYALGHPYQIADGFDEIREAFGETLKGFRSLAKSIEANAKISQDEAKEMEKNFFHLARFGVPFEYRLFLLLVAEQLPLETLTVAFHSVESDQSWPIYVTKPKEVS